MSNSTSDSTTPIKFVLYRYNPSKIAAIVFIAFFFVTTSLHMFLLWRKRTMYFIPFVIGGAFEALGYVARYISAKETPNWATGPYTIQSLLLLLAPTFFAASVYMILGRIIRVVDGEQHSVIRAKWLTKVFVFGDVLSFLTQGAGGGLLASAKTTSVVNRGELIIVGGLLIQILFFSVFIIVAGIFNLRIRKAPTGRSMRPDIPWQKYLYVLYVASGLILIRSAYRVVEYIEGNDGFLLRTELYLYIFDATMMFIATGIFLIFHPSMIINKESMAHTEGLIGPEPQDSNSYAMTDRPTKRFGGGEGWTAL